MQLATDTQSSPFSSPTASPQEGTVLGLTAKAMEKLLYFQETMPDAPGKDFRVFVEGGGCSGFQYGYTFDEAKSDDTLVDLGLIRILLDPYSLDYLKGSIVDFVETFGGGGFSVKNPNSSGGCGCGKSFSA